MLRNVIPFFDKGLGELMMVVRGILSPFKSSLKFFSSMGETSFVLPTAIELVCGKDATRFLMQVYEQRAWVPVDDIKQYDQLCASNQGCFVMYVLHFENNVLKS